MRNTEKTVQAILGRELTEQERELVWLTSGVVAATMCQQHRRSEHLFELEPIDFPRHVWRAKIRNEVAKIRVDDTVEIAIVDRYGEMLGLYKRLDRITG